MQSPVINSHRAGGGTSFVSRTLAVLVHPLVLLTILTMAGCAKNLGSGTSREMFNPGVQTAQVSALETEAGLEQIKVIAELEVRAYRITSSISVSEVIAICEKSPSVEYAEPNFKYEAFK